MRFLILIALIAAISSLDVITGEAASAGVSNPVAQVSVATSQEEYAKGEDIMVIVTNDLDTPITTFNQQASCSIVGLEKIDQGKWQRVKNCYSGVPVTHKTLPPKSETTVTLFGLAPGTYRAVFTFSLGTSFSFQDNYVSYSLEFFVTPA